MRPISLDGGANCTAAALDDQDGSPVAADTVTGDWHNRVVDLSGLQGCSINTIAVGLNTGSTGDTNGMASANFAELVFYSPQSAGLATLFNGGYLSSATALSGNNMPSGAIAYSTAGLTNGTLPGSTHFFTTDQVGTAQLEFAAGGWPVWQGEFTPYGGVVSASGPTANNYQFTGQERDQETADITNTGLDFMNARYYSSTLGRFTTPDPYMGSMDITNPQSFNRYTYALNNPLSFLDPSGLDCYDINGAPLTPSGDKTQNNCESDGGQWCPADACAYAGSPTPSMLGAPVPTDGLLPESPQQGNAPLFDRTRALNNYMHGCPSSAAQKAATMILNMETPLAAAQAVSQKTGNVIGYGASLSFGGGIPALRNVGGAWAGQAAIVVDSNGYVAAAISGAGGVGYGDGGSLTGDLFASSASSVFDLKGPSRAYFLGGGGEVGGYGSVSNNGGFTGAVGIGVGIGVVAGTITAGPTKVIPLICPP